MIFVTSNIYNKLVSYFPNKRIFSVIVFLLFCGFIYLLFIILHKSAEKGSDFSSLRNKLSITILDSCSVGLERYFSFYKHYPQCSDKYFYDSIKNCVSIPKVYIYSDSLYKGKFTRNGYIVSDTQLQNMSHTFIGIGSAQQYINYKSISGDSCVLYSVGENCLDENGGGDDVAYHKNIPR